MKHKILTLVLSIAVIASLILVGCAPEAAPPPAEAPPAEAPPEEEERFTIKFSDDAPETTAWSKAAIQPWGEYVEKVSGGRVTVEFYPSSVLHTNKDAYMAVQTGITDMCKLWHPAMPGTFPLMDMFSLPGLMPSSVVINSHIAIELYERWPSFEKQYSDKVEWIYSCVVMGSNVHSRIPLRNLDELKGKIISATSEPAAEALNALGASATVMTHGPDIYLSLQKGVIDGAFAAWAWVTGYKINEVAPYHLMVGLCPGSVGYVMRKEIFDKFTPEEQFMLKQYKWEGTYRNHLGSIPGAAMLARAEIPEGNIFELPPEEIARLKETFRPMWDEWADETEALGYPAHGILEDTIRLVEGYTSD